MHFLLNLSVLMTGVTACISPVVPDSQTTLFHGMCDASAATALDAERFIVADDEDNILRVYKRSGGEAVYQYDVSEFLGNQGKKKPKEADLEAAAQIGNLTFWITSHGRNSKGKDKPERQRIFATELTAEGEKIEIKPVGQSYTGLLDDLLESKSLEKYDLKAAAQLAPKDQGGLNIEGLSATPEGHLLIGFRNPIPNGKAILVPLLNPKEVIQGKKAELGTPVELDLQGLGIRGLGFYESRYLIIAGSPAEGGKSRLFEWMPGTTPKAIPDVTLEGMNPEGMAFHTADGRNEYFVLSDDGSLEVDGKRCKDLKDSSLKRFRGKTVKIARTEKAEKP
ncbi:MAG: DUF3616 domain-containing protein [Verrucomicrobiaceae bacterium]|nr:MAG: DUF3616 domain-containing protein [Verrucomicrobiaceae bacterium]